MKNFRRHGGVKNGRKVRSKALQGLLLSCCWRPTLLPARIHRFSLLHELRGVYRSLDIDRLPQPRVCSRPWVPLSSSADESISSGLRENTQLPLLPRRFLLPCPALLKSTRLPNDVDNLGKTSISVGFQTKVSFVSRADDKR